MDHSAILIGFAQLSLVLTGFVAAFVAFFSDKKSSSKPDVHHALSMLIGSVVSLIMALIPIVFHSYGLTGEDLWFWSSVIASALGTVYGMTMLNISLRLTRDELRKAGYLHMFCSYALGIAGCSLMFWNALHASEPGYYFLGMILILMVALVGFITFAIQNFLKI